jgi:outer membrane protein TolC
MCLFLLQTLFASSVTLNELLENAQQPQQIQKAIESDALAMESKNLANTQTTPLTFEHGLSRSSSKIMSGFEHEIGFSKELKLGNIQKLEQQQTRLNNEAQSIEQEKYLITLSNRLKNSYHQYCLDSNYVHAFQEKYRRFSLLHSKKKTAYKHDEIAKTELLQLALEKNKLHNELENFHQKVEDEKHQILALAGFSEGDFISCQEVYPIAEQVIFDNTHLALTQKAFEKRIESRQVGLKRHSYKVESVELSMGYLKELERDVYTISVSVPLTLSSRKSEYERASLMHEASALSFQNEQVVAQKEYEVKTLQKKLRRNFQAIQSTQNSIEEYTNSLLPLMKKSYDYGESSVTEYLLSQQQLSQQEEKLLEEKKGYYQTLFTLYQISEKR